MRRDVPEEPEGAAMAALAQMLGNRAACTGNLVETPEKLGASVPL